jgi:hypothetical protein
MSTLNRAETKALQDAAGMIDWLGKPTDETHTDENRAELAKKAKDLVKTVVTMKGHYDS